MLVCLCRFCSETCFIVYASISYAVGYIPSQSFTQLFYNPFARSHLISPVHSYSILRMTDPTKPALVLTYPPRRTPALSVRSGRAAGCGVSRASSWSATDVRRRRPLRRPGAAAAGGAAGPWSGRPAAAAGGAAAGRRPVSVRAAVGHSTYTR